MKPKFRSARTWELTFSSGTPSALDSSLGDIVRRSSRPMMRTRSGCASALTIRGSSISSMGFVMRPREFASVRAVTRAFLESFQIVDELVLLGVCEPERTARYRVEVVEVDDLAQRLEDAVVHVGRGVAHVAQRRRVEALRHARRPRVVRRPAELRRELVVLRHVGVHDEIVGELRAAVAADAAALADEELLAGELALGEPALVVARERRLDRS